MIFRITHNEFEYNHDSFNLENFNDNEWKITTRLNEDSWKLRYDYEAKIISKVIKDNNFKTILELGSGPGELSKLIQENVKDELTYHLVDKPFAKKYFEDNNYKGTFFAKDISIDLDTEGLLPKYDLIICNDVLEHLLCPSNIVKKCYYLLNENSMFFVSIPNWRMAHTFIYRGLFDYDNFLYFMYSHNFDTLNVYKSILDTPFYEKLDSEEYMPNELLQSWNFYFTFKIRELRS